MRQKMTVVPFAFRNQSMIPLSLQRAQHLFGRPLGLSEFGKTIEGNPHHWNDAEIVLDTAHTAITNATLLQCPQTFVVRVRNGDYDGMEYVSLVFEANASTIVLKQRT